MGKGESWEPRESWLEKAGWDRGGEGRWLSKFFNNSIVQAAVVVVVVCYCCSPSFLFLFLAFSHYFWRRVQERMLYPPLDVGWFGGGFSQIVFFIVLYRS